MALLVRKSVHELLEKFIYNLNSIWYYDFIFKFVKIQALQFWHIGVICIATDSFHFATYDWC